MEKARMIVSKWLQDSIIGLNSKIFYIESTDFVRLIPYVKNGGMTYNEWMVSCLTDILNPLALCGEILIIGTYENDSTQRYEFFHLFREAYEEFIKLNT